MIAIDWGTSSLRAYRLDGQGQVLEQRSVAVGLLACRGRFDAVLAEQLQDWDDPLVLMAGMIGSRNGWREVPYVRCPAGIDEIAAGIVELPAGGLEGRHLFIAPGLAQLPDAATPEVMRGEEVQVLGLADELPADGLHTLCLPGTHSKWVQLQGGRILSLRSAMTGELFALLRQHSLLGALMGAEARASHDSPAFERGVQASAAPGGLSHHLFGVRTLGLFDRLAPDEAPSYLSGLLIGHELRGLVPAGCGCVHLIGEDQLVRSYAHALALLQTPCRAYGQALSARGLFRLARHNRGLAAAAGGRDPDL
jgi:2-dehydro-3-deoxygalactonokinase